MMETIGIDLGARFCRTACYKNGSSELLLEADINDLLGAPPVMLKRCNSELGSFWKITSLKNEMGSESVEALGSKLFKKIKAISEDKSGGEVCGAVITIPPCFPEWHRAALRRIAASAGFKKLRILDEPLAFLKAAGRQSGLNGKTVVYALGAGACYVSIYDVKDGKYTPLHHEGDRELFGGDAIDGLILEKIISGKEKVTNHPSVQALLPVLLGSVEKAKIQILNGEEEGVEMNPAGGLMVRVTRSDVYDLVNELAEHTVIFLEKAFRSVDMTKEDVDNVFISGRSAGIPLIVEKISAATGKEPASLPDGKIAEGAAIYAAESSIDLVENSTEFIFDDKKQSVASDVNPGGFCREDYFGAKAEAADEGASVFDKLSKYVSMAEDCSLRNDWKGAVSELELMGRKTSEFIAIIYQKLGLESDHDGRIEKAIEYLEQALKFDDTNRDIWHSLGKEYCRLAMKRAENGFYPEARKALKECLRCDPGNKHYKNFLAEINLAIKKQRPSNRGGHKPGKKKKRK